MSDEASFAAEGGCTCRAVRYRLMRRPLIVHCCHCHWCQRETGSAFAINAMIESSELKLLCGTPEYVATPARAARGRASPAARPAASRCGATTQAWALR
jgi:hypothetical protein